MRQAARQWRGAIGLELAIGEMRQAVALGTDQPPAGRAEPGIEAEDQHKDISSPSPSGEGLGWGTPDQRSGRFWSVLAMVVMTPSMFSRTSIFVNRNVAKPRPSKYPSRC